MTYFRTGFGLALVALLLGACTVSFESTPPDAEIEARTSTAGSLANESARTNETLASGERMLIGVDVPSAGEDGLYLYLDRPLGLSVKNSSRATIASSPGPDFFASGTLVGLSDAPSADPSLAPSVVATQACPGSCVILRNSGSRQVFMEVRNDTGSTVNVGVYAVLREFDDGNERRNEPIRFSSNEQGALETLGDTDVYEAGRDGELFFDAVDSTLDFQATVRDPGGSFSTTLSDGESTEVFEGDRITVQATNSRAAVSSKSSYFLEIQ